MTIERPDLAALRKFYEDTWSCGKWVLGPSRVGIPGIDGWDDVLRLTNHVDAALIVAAVNVLPALIEWIEELEAALTEATHPKNQEIWDKLDALAQKLVALADKGQPKDADWHLEPDEMKP